MIEELGVAERYRVEENAVLLVITEVIAQGFGFLVSMLVARILGVQSYGLLAFAYSLSMMCLVIPSFGFTRLTIRELARRPARVSRFLTTISVVVWALSLPMGAICGFAVWLGSHSVERLFIVVPVFFIMVAQHHIELLCAFYRAAQKVGRETIIRSTLAFLWFVTGLAVLFIGFGLEPLVGSRLVVTILCLGFAVFLVKKDFSISLTPFRWRYARTLMQISVPFALFHIVVMIFHSVILVILGFMRGDVDAGYYSAADKIITLLFVIPVSLAWATFPVLSKEWRASREGFLATYRKTLRYLVILAVPVAVAVYFLGDRALLMLFGKEYLPSIPVLKVLAFGIIPFFIIQVNSIALISMDRQGAAVWAAVIGSLAAVIFSLILVPFHGPLGAALSRTLALLCLAVGEFVLLSRSMSWQGMWSTCSRSLISGSIMALVLLFFSTGGLSLPLLVAGCSSVYIAALLITGEITFREVRGFSSLLSGIVRSFKPGKDFSHKNR